MEGKKDSLLKWVQCSLIGQKISIWQYVSLILTHLCWSTYAIHGASAYMARSARVPQLIMMYHSSAFFKRHHPVILVEHAYCRNTEKNRNPLLNISSSLSLCGFLDFFPDLTLYAHCIGVFPQCLNPSQGGWMTSGMEKCYAPSQDQMDDCSLSSHYNPLSFTWLLACLSIGSTHMAINKQENICPLVPYIWSAITYQSTFTFTLKTSILPASSPAPTSRHIII